MNWLSVFITVFHLAFLSPSDTDSIRWQEERPLTWDDFRGTPKQWGSYVASTSSGISFSYSIGTSSRGGQDISYSVETLFYPGSSWYNPEAVDPYILRHEQTHFDISELHARIFRKRLSEVEFGRDAEAVLSSLYEENEKARRAMQSLYDKETDHSNVREAEERWVRYVQVQLAEYSQWKDAQ